MIAKNRFIAIFTVFMFLTSLAMASVPVQSQSPPTFYVDQPLGYIEAKPAGTTFWVDILVNASDVPFYSPDGMVGWGLLVQVDPTVLKPVAALGAEAGYFLYDYAVLTGISGSSPPTLLANIDEATGLVDVSEQLVPTPAHGAGTDDPYGPLMPSPQLLVSIQFESLTLYADTTIDIINPEYMDTYATWHAVVDGDGFYQGLPPVPVGANLVGKKGWAEHHRFPRSKHGDPTVPDSHGTPGIMTFFAKIKNIGDVPLTVRAVFRMSKTGVVEPMVISNEVLLEPGDTVIVQGDARVFVAADDGKWTLDAFCEYYFAGVWNLGETSRTTGFVVLA